MHVKANGGIKVIHPASGLVTALEPVMRACSGVWVAHGSGSADRETVDIKDRVPVPPGEGSYLLRRVWLTEEEENGYYYGLSNEGLWPLCHVAHARPVFRSEDWAHYVAVNRKFADAVCQEVDRDDPIVLVQDYHFAPGAAHDPRDAAARHDHHLLAHPVAERRAHRHLPVARGADLGPARLERGRLPHAAPLQQLHRLGRRLHGEPHRSRGARRRAGRPQHAGAAVPDLDRVAGALARRRGARRIRRGSTCGASWASRPTRCSASASIASTTPRASRSACRRSTSCCAATRSSAAASPSCSWPRRAAPRSSATAS